MTETIGTCDVCGATDHHLVEGLCPVCQSRTTTVTIDWNMARKVVLAEDADRAPGVHACNEGDEL